MGDRRRQRGTASAGRRAWCRERHRTASRTAGRRARGDAPAESRDHPRTRQPDPEHGKVPGSTERRGGPAHEGSSLKILLTGANGNLGTTLTKAGGGEFVPLGREDWPDLPGLLASGIDAVLHTAWDLKTSVTARPEAVFDANVMTTMRLLEACRDTGIEKFALISTCAVYGERLVTAEDSACCPVTINGLTKLLNEQAVQAFCADAGIECQIYRVFNMFGGNDRFSILSHLRNAIDQGAPFRLNNRGEARRDFIHVDDVARIVMTLLPMSLPAVHMNVGTGRATRVSDVVAAVQRHHPDLRIEETSAKEVEYSRADIDRLTTTLGELDFIDVIDFVETTFAD